ncbi:MAG: hypothetical protein JXB17_09105 [Bacteroidales bacterium]|nr:hypothetical protein [Bacteroidales bacterium]
MLKRFRIFFYSIICAFLFVCQANSQFYNGLEMTFGKNRLQYNDFIWSYYRFENFDAYFNQFGKNLAQYTAKYAQDKIIEIENFFDYKLDKRLIFIIYNKLTDFRQSNIGLITGEETENLGGVTKILDNKVFIYYEQDHRQLERQINKAICEVIITEMLVGNNIRDRVTNLASLNLPDWYVKGLISYIAEEWNVEFENKLKDGILSGKYRKFSKLTDEDAIIAGHSLWRYLALTYGKSIIPSIIYLTRLNKNSNKGFFNVLGIKMKHLIKEWEDYYFKQYCNQYEMAEFDETGKIIKRTKKARVYQNISVSPNYKYIAYSTNELGKYIIWLYNTETQRKKKIFKRGFKLRQETDYTFPVMAWHPSSKIISFFTEEKGGIKLYFYNVETKELISKNFLYFEKILGFSYSKNGYLLVLSGARNGQTDIFVHNLTSSTNFQVTNDIADDIQPRFIDNSQKIIFSSNRISDTLRLDKNINLINNDHYDLFIYNYENNSDKLIKLTSENVSDDYEAFEINKNEYIYLSDENGILNRYMVQLDSAISYIDTAIHYKYVTSNTSISDYPVNINEQYYSLNDKKIGEILFRKKRYHLFYKDLSFKKPDTLEKTKYKKYYFDKIFKRDSIRLSKEKYEKTIDNTLPDSVIKRLQDPLLYLKSDIDINNYIFEIEKRYTFDKDLNPIINFPGKKVIDDESDLPQIRIYQTAFYPNFVVSQIDFGFMNASYQPFTGNGRYFNPGTNGLFKIGTNDLFEDYKITGGFRLSRNLNSNEYLVSFENLKNRIDKQLIFHRQALIEMVTKEDENIYDASLKTHSNNLMFVFNIPYNQVKAFKTTFSIREDRSVYISEDINTLRKPNVTKIWTGIKLEYIFDNSIKLGINLYDGTRYKIFGEFYKTINEKKTDLFVLGADFRHYQRIHRDLIFAGRIAGSTSFGTSRLLYYLGSVDNWLIPRRDNSIPINEYEKYGFQAIATNMRGFYQNARNGNNFVVINSEIRWPIFRYFSPYPISSKFFSNFQVVGFFDIGSAWTGLNPYGGENAYDKEVRKAGNVTVVIESNRDPIIYGFGYGVRMQLLGYFIRLDWAYGIDSKVLLPRVFYISLNLDF